MDRITINPTQQWMIDALLSLMDEKDYHEITIVELVQKADLGRRTFYRYFKSKDEILKLHCDFIMQDFAGRILEKEEVNLYTISIAYFECWNNHIHFLTLLRKSNMLYFIGNLLPELMVKVAVMTGHVSKNNVYDNYNDYWYAHHFNMGGYWSITTQWASKDVRETPKEMADIITKLIFRDSVGET